MTLLNFKPEILDDSRRPDDRPKEKVFLEHYSWLLGCALNVTRGQRERAEDLVHDVYVQFMAKEIVLASIADARLYLNGILRNLHLLQLRRAVRHPLEQLSLFDHDSALIGLRAWNSEEQLQVADLLLRACDFTCYRKEASLNASVLILRFFHGYYPGEISLLLGAKRKVVDKCIERGRNEMKQYLELPYPIPGRDLLDCKTPSVSSSTALLRHLRERIFSSCKTSCSVLPEGSLDFKVRELAHLVSCRACLDRCSRSTGLPDIAGRMFDDISDHVEDDGRSQGGRGAGGDILSLRPRGKQSRRKLLRQLHTRRRELFEHRPKEISLAFDGQIHATLLVDAPSNKLHLSLDSKEVPNSIAVLSEQEFKFLLLDRDDLMCSERRVHRLSLSDDRLLEVAVTPETLGTSIQVTYKDPFFSLMSGADEDEELRTIAAEERVLSFPSGSAGFAEVPRLEWRVALFDKLRGLVPAMNPTLATALILAVASVMCFVVWWHQPPRISANTFMARAEAWDSAGHTATTPGVVYQRIRIKTSQRLVNRAIYRDAQGARRPKQQLLNAVDTRLKDQLSVAGVNWDEPLSAISYQDWHDHQRVREDAITRAGEHLLKLTTTVPNGPVLQESLTVRESDFHPVARTIELQNAGTIEIAELDYRVLPWGPDSDNWFESSAASILGSHLSPHTSIVPRVPNLPSETELDEVELEARLALHQMDADSTNERIEIGRSAKGVQVKGVVATSERKRAIESRLHPIPHLFSSIFTFDELAVQQNAANGVTSIKSASISETPSPLDEYLANRGMTHSEIGELSSELSDASVSVSQEGKAVAALLADFGSNKQLSPAAQAAFERLFTDRKEKILSSLKAEEGILAQAGVVPAPVNANGAGGQLMTVIERHRALASELLLENNPHPRNAQEIALELDQSIRRLRSIVEGLSDPHPASALSSPPSSNQNKK